MADARHTAVLRESQLAATQIAHGVTALGHANHTQPGLYAQAFFGLSIGLERLGKLIYIIYHANTNAARFPTNDELRHFGHDIATVLRKCNDIAKAAHIQGDYVTQPVDPIHQNVVEVLSEFGVRSRYYNLNYLAGGAGSQQDPIALWWKKVAEPICARHYSERQRAQDELNGQFLEQFVGPHGYVLHTQEDGSEISSMHEFGARGHMTRVVQKYGRLYTLQIVRWLVSILYELSHDGAYCKRIEAFLGCHEPFAVFYNEDKMLRDRKRWSAYL